jgi:hypothetical protein
MLNCSTGLSILKLQCKLFRWFRHFNCTQFNVFWNTVQALTLKLTINFLKWSSLLPLDLLPKEKEYFYAVKNYATCGYAETGWENTKSSTFSSIKSYRFIDISSNIAVPVRPWNSQIEKWDGGLSDSRSFKTRERDEWNGWFRLGPMNAL